MMRFAAGKSELRTEDQRFVTGQGEYLDDIQLSDTLVLMFLRSPCASGEIATLRTDAARAVAGVHAIYTIAELDAAGIANLPAEGIPGVIRRAVAEPLGQSALARDRVRYVGEPIVAVVAETKTIAQSALDAIELEITTQAAVADIGEALAPAAPTVHETVAGNVLGHLQRGDKARCEAVFADADHVIDIDLINNRVCPVTMEPRGCIATFDAAGENYTLYQGCQGVHIIRDRVVACMPIEKQHLRVVCPDVGGAFGFRMSLQCETISVLHAARELGRPIKWLATRSESFLADLHGRDHRTHARLALDGSGKFLALEVLIDSNIGAYESQFGAFVAWIGASMSTGCYTIPVCYAAVRLVMSNTVPTEAYRGAGRPEALYVIERLVDKAARQLGIAPDVIRRHNFIAPDAFPYTAPAGQCYDSGEYERLMDIALARADWSGFEKRRQRALKANRLRGIGLAYYVEVCAGFGAEQPELSFDRAGNAQVLVGTQSSGQGHETTYAQMVAAEFSLPIEKVKIIQGDTALFDRGEGTGGSRTMGVGGSALGLTIDAAIEQGKKIAASKLETTVANIDFANGVFRASDGEKELTLQAVLEASFKTQMGGVNQGLRASERFAPKAGTFSNGAHICELEIDPDTGAISIERYTVQDDMGVVLNPQLMRGQIVGGVVQGIGQAMLEQAVYEPGNAAALSTSFLDYAIPRAGNMPAIDFDYTQVPSPSNPLGVKGAGEAGTIGAPPAVVNAAIDALAHLGVTELDMPLTREKLWRTIRSAAPN